MSKTKKIILILSIVIGLIIIVTALKPEEKILIKNKEPANIEEANVIKEEAHPLNIVSLRQDSYPGGDFVIEETLANGANYKQSVASYLSEGLKIYGLLTIPMAPKPENGYPSIVFVHGYISPKQYSTIGNYPTYQARLARSGFITFKPDLRGHGQSEGEPASAHYSEKYTLDVLYAIAYLKKYAEADSERIGYWGHSNGGEIGLRILVVSTDIKAASFWAGVVGSYEDMIETYNEKISFLRNNNNPLIKEYGLPSDNPEFWKKIDPYFYLEDITAPIELHHGTADPSVPIELSRSLKVELEKLNKPVEYYEYAGDNHNISGSLNTAWPRTIKFFEDNL